MNKIKTIIRAVALIAVVSASTGCLDNFEDYNRNPNEATDDELERDNYLVGSKLTKLQNMVIPSEEHLYQFVEALEGGSYGGYVEATVDSWETKFSTFNPTTDWLKAPFVDVITETYPAYRGIINKTDDEVAVALANVLRVAIMNRLADAYGSIPYSKIVEDKKERLTVPYDTQQEAYTQMFKELDTALEALERNRDLSTEAFGEYDQVYNGNLKKWIKYANSLKLRMAMRLSYIDEQTAKAKAAEAIAAGVITENADNAKLQPELNRTTLLWNSWQDHAIGADILCYMNGYKDPRMEKMFLANDVGDYVGIRIGIDVTSKSQAVSKYSNMIVASDTPYLWFNAAEATFLRAEYELRWGSEETARSLYEAAVRLSFEERGASGADAYLAQTDVKPAPYTDPVGNYSAMAQSDIGIPWVDGAENFERNLERIIVQKWIAIFPLGVEAWSEHRRTGYPRLLPAVEDKSGGTVDLAQGARRLPYPVEEYDKNNANLQDAVQMLNSESQGSRKGDGMGTRVWWDVKPYNN